MYQTDKIYITSDMKMSDVLLNNPYLMLLLEHFGMQVPVQEKTIENVCNEYNISTGLFITFANLYNGTKFEPANPFQFSDTPAILNYLINNHKYYLDEIYPNIRSIIKQMYATDNSDETQMVENFFNDYFNEVKEHLLYENDIVHPYISELYEIIRLQGKKEGQSKYSVSEYKDHHDDIEEKLNDLKSLLVKYLPLKDDQSLRRKLLFNLSELEFDLHIHSLIEDMILVPLVARMEKHLKGEK